tara:strand:- start:34390 stop:34569 length:180 start_codon:yes stop_codon:yes gene_type:complete
MAKEKAEKVKPNMTYNDIKAMIIGSEEKVTLLNVFAGLLNENVQLKKELDQLKSDKPKQ